MYVTTRLIHYTIITFESCQPGGGCFLQGQFYAIFTSPNQLIQGHKTNDFGRN
jgi:hypothetical protein